MQGVVRDNPLFPCQYCEKLFLSNKNLILHEKVHAKTGMLETVETFKCQICNKAYMYLRSLMIHLEQIHKSSNICSTCHKVFSTKSDLQTHSFSAKHYNPYFCHDCNIDCFDELDLDCHLFVKHPTSWEILKKAEMLAQKKNVQIINSPIVQAVSSYSNSNEKIEMHHGFRKRLDGLVKNKQQCLQLKQNHQDNHHKPKYVCLICKADFEFWGHFKRHSQHSHTGDPQFRCQLCRAEFQSKSGLYYHKVKVHQRDSKFSTESKKIKLLDRREKNFQPPKTCQQPKSPIYIRQTLMEDPHLWPKVVMSRRLNDLLMYQKG